MPSLKDTKRRIGSVKNTQKITQAMKLVSAAKFARANHAVIDARPYAQHFQELLKLLLNQALLKNITDKKLGILTESVVGAQRELLIIISTDRGLCGSLNSALFKVVTKFIATKKSQLCAMEIGCWGKRASLFAKKLNLPIVAEKEKVSDKPTHGRSADLAKDLVNLYLEGNYSAIHVAYVEFKSAMTQTPMIQKLLPVTFAEAQDAINPISMVDILTEPDLKTLLIAVLERLAAVQILKFLLESYASEQGARMSAMDSATKNAKEVIRKLTLQYNRARQAAITKELIEITSGAEAL